MGLFRNDSPSGNQSALAPPPLPKATEGDILGHARPAPQNHAHTQPAVTNAASFGDFLGMHIGSGNFGHVTDSVAQKHSIVYACTRIIAGSISQCPLRCYEGTDGLGGDACAPTRNSKPYGTENRIEAGRDNKPWNTSCTGCSFAGTATPSSCATSGTAGASTD